MDEYVKRAICHEAGHAVAALHLGFHIEKIAVCEGRPYTQIQLDSSQECTRQRYIVLTGGIAGEKLVYSEYDQEGAADDQRKISERKGDCITGYLHEALNIMRSNETRFCELRKRLTCRWVERAAAAAFEPDPDSFDLLSHREIKETWEGPENSV